MSVCIKCIFLSFEFKGMIDIFSMSAVVLFPEMRPNHFIKEL